MKKFDIIKAIKHNDQLILCKSDSGLTIRFAKINFIKQTATKQMVFTTEAGERVVLKADKINAGEYNPCGKHSDCWVTTMSGVKKAGRFSAVECGSIAF